MSRTYRDSWANDWVRNLEDFETRTRGYSLLHYISEPSVAVTEEYFAYFRDGAYNESSRNRGYKDDTNKLIRNDNRIKINKMMDDPDSYDGMVFATKYSGKFIRWIYW
jgi:nitrous oxidase accessory protein NosD